MGGYVQVRVTSGKNIGGQVSHDGRRRKPAYVDCESHVVMMVYKADSDEYMDNNKYHVLSDDDSNIKRIQELVKEEMQRRIKSQQKAYRDMHKRAMPKTSNHFFKGIITFSHENTVGEATNDMDRKHLDMQADMFLRIINDEYGVYPLYLTRHEDETTVHYHFVCENFDYDKARTVQRALSRGQFYKMQDLVGEAFAPDRYQRGEPKFTTGANHVKFQDWERQQIAKANAEAKETAHIVQNNKSDITELRTMVKDASSELIEIHRLIVEKEDEIEEGKEILGTYKELRKSHLEVHSDGMDDDGVSKLRKIEELTGNGREVLGVLRGELKDLKVRRDELLGGVESKEVEILDVIESVESVEEKLEDVEKKVSTQKNK
jgi:hypothetical protein